MKIVLFNGSPKKEGNTYHVIKFMEEVLKKEGIETEIIHVGNSNISGCLACGKCGVNKDEKCVIDGDKVNEWIQKMKESDGIILGSPVHYTSVAGNMKSFLDRAFFVASANDNLFRHKVGGSFVTVRRAGALTALDLLNNYFNYMEMIVPTSSYWNVVYGAIPGESLKDIEGIHTIKVLTKNIAWAIKLIENGKNTVIEPERENKPRMNFIR